MPALNYPRNRYAFSNADAMERVLYNTIMPTTEYGTLLYAGSCNLVLGYQNILAQMQAVQATHRTQDNLGKQIIHAIITFTDEELSLVHDDISVLVRFCDMLSRYYDGLGFQNVYGIRRGTDGRIHVEYTINSVNYITRRKMVCTNALQMEHQEITGFIFNMVMEERARLDCGNLDGINSDQCA